VQVQVHPVDRARRPEARDELAQDALNASRVTCPEGLAAAQAVATSA